jgi:hypothetical protein
MSSEMQLTGGAMMAWNMYFSGGSKEEFNYLTMINDMTALAKQKRPELLKMFDTDGKIIRIFLEESPKNTKEMVRELSSNYPKDAEAYTLQGWVNYYEKNQKAACNNFSKAVSMGSSSAQHAITKIGCR